MVQLKKILKSFARTLDQLEQLISLNNVKVDQNTQEIDRLQQFNLTLMAEAQAAKNVAQNIRNLITTETGDTV
ncbi:hypothetical protein [Pseudomonas sp. Sample_16]|uniref:hypothetical protein n=1 Tax=Pseudomonas sp. Sample_16 TaxID=2448263 RepID=UPI001032D2EC|nr:hypothetical protein [Pseudomonas sp. Sample_16]